MNHKTLGVFCFLACTGLGAQALQALEVSVESADGEYCKVSFINAQENTRGLYQGQCKEGVPDGAGTVLYRNGDRFEGTFSNGVINGRGTLTSASGNVYEGNWVDGHRHGEGRFTWARGSQYVGDWIADQRHGKGTFTWANGNRFEGEFRNNKRHSGTYYTTSGRIVQCQSGRCE
ncbi:MAG TPA: hypothetical protein VL027_14550 [Spongiibacteraceae bacterium]|nr:hypothetical protein [Spongiibacteraceae bacterium]